LRATEAGGLAHEKEAGTAVAASTAAATAVEVECSPGCGVGGSVCPLVVALHGMGDPTASSMRGGLFGWGSSPTAQGKFCIAFPLPVSGGDDWSVKNDSPDYQYIVDVAHSAIRTHNIDTARVFLVGYSQGGMAGYKVMCRTVLDNPYVAFVAVAIQVPWIYQHSSSQKECCPNHDFHAMHVHGTDDTVIPFGTLKNWACLTGEDFVRRHGPVDNGCTVGPVNRASTNVANANIEEYTQGCSSKGSAVMMTLEDATHWVLTTGLWKDMWDFLESSAKASLAVSAPPSTEAPPVATQPPAPETEQPPATEPPIVPDLTTTSKPSVSQPAMPLAPETEQPPATEPPIVPDLTTTSKPSVSQPAIEGALFLACAPTCGHASMACPLIVALHAKEDDDASEMRKNLFGTVEPTFQEGDYCIVFPAPISGTDFKAEQDSADIARIIDVTERVIENYNIDREEVFLFGWSHGAIIAYLTVCRAGVMTPFVAVSAASHQVPWTRSGSPPEWACCPNTGFRLMHAHGTADRVLPLTTKRNWACALPVDFVRSRGEVCSGPEFRTAQHLPNTQIEAYDHNCKGRSSAAFYKLEGAGHMILSPALWSEVWDFFVDSAEPPVLPGPFWNPEFKQLN
jgi:poly(3-hydroxybutyrate) depolymerase